MRRLALISVGLVCAVIVGVLGTAAGGGGSSGGTYKVRAIFDSAFTVIPGEDVKIAGVKVGKIGAVDLTADNKAAVELDISQPGFGGWRSDATCTIRPQSLIGERYVECLPTQPRAPGAPVPPPLATIRQGRPGAGDHLLPVTRTTREIDLDLVNNTLRLPYAERLRIIVNELGGALAANGQELNQAIRRADPALYQTDRVLNLLGNENRVLRDLAQQSDTDLAPLAQRRQQVADFIVQANAVSQATAARRVDLERNLQKLPAFLAQLKPTMQRLGAFSDQARPVLADLGSEAPALTRFINELGPFSNASIPALTSLGQTADVGRVALPKALPVINQVRTLARSARPLAANLNSALTSLRDTGGIERLMDYLFFQVASINGFDSVGHYLRSGLIVNTCSSYATTPTPGCSSNFHTTTASSASAASASGGDLLLERTRRVLDGETAAQAIAATGGPRAGLPAARSAAPGRRGARHRRGATRRLRLPRTILPGDAAAPSPSPAQAGASTAPGPQASGQLLSYLLGGSP